MSALRERLAALSPARRALFELLVIEETLEGAAPPAARPAAAEPAPPVLSFGQERLWLLDRLDPGSAAYNTAAALRLTGRLAPQLLAASFAEIARRHEVLRTTFRERGGRPEPVLAPAGTVELPVVDLSGLRPAAAEAALQRAIGEEVRRPFDLALGPLYRARLFRLAAREHVLLATLHHAVSDAWSMGVLARELTVLHAAFAAGLPSPLPELPLQYADHARSQRRRLSGPALEAEFAWWRERLAGAPEVLEVPPDRPRPERRRWRGGTERRLLPQDLAAAVARLCRERSATPFMALLAAFAVVLHDRANAADLVVGVDVANRESPGTEALIGFFVNQVVLRIDAAGDPTFGELLERVRETALGTFAHQELPFGRLVEELAPRRSLARNPLFQVMFGFYNVPEPAAELGGLQVAPLDLEGGTAVFDLSLYLAESPEGLAATLRYDADLFEPATAAALLADFAAVARRAVEAPKTPLSALAGELAAERRKRLDELRLSLKEARERTLQGARRRALAVPPKNPES